IAGGAVDVLSADELAALGDHHADETRERPRRARVGVGLWILSDVMFVLPLLFGFLYLKGLNTQGQFKPATESHPSTLGSWLLVALAIAGAAVWMWGYNGARDGNALQGRTGMTVGWILTIGGLIGDVILFAGLKAPSPLHAYASGVGLFTFYHAWHLIIGLAVASIVLVRQ